MSGESVRTILVVDDNADVCATLGMLLRIFGYEVVTAANGREALDYLATHDAPAAIVLDLRMPVMGGVAFRRAQLADAALAAIPVVVYSGEIDLATRSDLGDVAVYPKSADPAGLLRLLQSLAGGLAS